MVIGSVNIRTGSKGSSNLCIKTFISEHTCWGNSTFSHKQATQKIIADIINDKFQQRPGLWPHRNSRG